MKITWRLTSFILILALFLTACGAAKPSPTPTLSPTPAPPTEMPTAAPPTFTPTPAGPSAVGVVSGLPQGSQGYPWWNDSTFYEIFVRSFYDSNGDGIGDFNGLTEKLDYLNDGDPATTTDLGVTALWLMPIFPAATYHGYDVTDYYTVNPDYGTLDDFKHLLSEARKRGIRIILDLPLNHTSLQHPWFKASQDPQSPYRNWYIWSNTDPGYLGPWDEKVWHQAPDGNYYYGVFEDRMPDLNYTNPEVTAEMEKIAKFWLEEVKVDGFRLDGARHLIEEGKNQASTKSTHTWLKNFNAYIKSIVPASIIVGEVLANSFEVFPYVQQDELDLAFDFDLAKAYIASANAGRADNARSQLTIDLRGFPPGQFAPFLTNHDLDRVMSQLGGDPQKAKNAITMLLTAPGAPFLYYGEEIGMQGKKPDELIRAPMQWTAGENAGFTSGTPWEAVEPSYPQVNVDTENGQPDSLLNFYRLLVNLRNQHAALRIGDTQWVEPNNPAVYSVLRASKEEAVLTVINLSSEPVSDYSLGLGSGLLARSYQVLPLIGEGEFPALSVNAGGGFDAYQPLPSLPADSRLILQLRPQK